MSEPSTPTSSSSRTVLVADDESHILNVVSLKLRNAGFNVICAHDGTEALEMALSNKPDLLITDYHMPGLNGLEVASRLRQSETCKQMPAILLSARGYNLNETDIRESGISLQLSKPFSPRNLLSLVNQALGIAA
jgi:two-component system, OmpR family, alkaline phosphatase synthesis response regulator PhoP